MKELVITSGKGGTGKTSLVASLALLARESVLADCDVDAADLHLILQPKVLETTPFVSGREATIRPESCSGCGICAERCRFDAVQQRPETHVYRVDPLACEGCGVCVRFCPEEAIDFEDRLCGEWFISETRAGAMVHARLGIAAENSGKLVTTVRKAAQKIAEDRNADWLLVDGSPGIGCPVIASITGADGVLVVTEPTVSGLHDLERVLSLTSHFNVPTAVCVNKWDVNPEAGARIEKAAEKQGAQVLTSLGYHPSVTHAQVKGKAVVELEESPLARSIQQLWKEIQRFLTRS